VPENFVLIAPSRFELLAVENFCAQISVKAAGGFFDRLKP
jgi:hypothetical protein